ncbi:MAG: hypothetical protein M0T83_06335 [Nitrospiraceae bacterium]|nr:hypothetical protein [Nitrospiraceae bacterium]
MLGINDDAVGSRGERLVLKRLVEKSHAGQDDKSTNGQGHCATNGMPNAKTQGNRYASQGNNDRRKQYKN